jgi:uncharacterized protein (DUF58 family)
MNPTESLLEPGFVRKLEALSLVSKRIFPGRSQGERRSPRRGASVEFAEFREYAFGDDLRYVDWKAYGRLDRLYVKQFIDEEDLNLHLLLDTSQSMGFGEPVTKSLFAARAAAALGYLALSEFDRVSLVSYSNVLKETLPHMRGKSSVPNMLRFLQRGVEVSGQSNAGKAISRYASTARNIGVAIVFTDGYDDSLKDGLRALTGHGFQSVVIHILGEDELSPDLAGDFLFEDSETGETRDISASPYLLGLYDARLKEFCTTVERDCKRYNASYVRISTATPVQDVILTSLRRIGVVY